MGAREEREGQEFLEQDGLPAGASDDEEEPGELNKLVEIGRNVFAVLGGRGEANAGFVVGAEQVLVVDAKATPRMARHLIEQIRRVTSKHIQFLVNTHFHGDHTFGNQTFAALPAVIVAHERARQRMITEGEPHLRGFTDARKDLVPDLTEVRLTFPSVTFQDRMDLYVDERPIQLRYVGDAHTDGDIVVFLPTERLIFTADLLFGHVIPGFAVGNAMGWIGALDAISRLPVETIVPGHGRLSTSDDVREMRQFLVDLVEAVRQGMSRGVEVEEAVRLVTLEKYRHWRMRERLPFAVSKTYKQLKEVASIGAQ